MAERVLLESADGLTKEIEIDASADVIKTSYLPPITPYGEMRLTFLERRYELRRVRQEDGMKVYREVIE